MNTKHFITAVALTLAAAAGPVLAQEATYDYATVQTSQTTRAAVLADLAVARAEGTLQVNEASVGHSRSFMAPRNRQAVSAEARKATRSGQVAAWTAEPQAFAIDAPAVAPSLTVAAK